MADSSRRRGKDRRDLSLVRVVAAIRPAAVRYFVWDAAEAGFGIDVWPSGTRTWMLFYRARGVQRRMSLGSVDALPPKAARDRARQLKVAVAEDRDPLQERREGKVAAQSAERARREAATFGELAGRYLASLRAKKSPRWASEAERILTADLLPTLGAVPIATLNVPAVRALHEAMRERPFAANRAKAIVSAVVARAEEDGDRDRALTNPAHAVKDYPEPPRQREFRTEDWRALARAWRLAHDEFATLPERDTRATQLQAITLLALTGARVGAVMPRRVADVDLEARILTVKPAHKRVARILLGAAAVRTVAPLVTGAAPRAFLFPGQARRVGEREGRGERDERPERAPSAIASVRPAWSRVVELSGLEDLRLHDLRGAFASVGTELSYTTFIIGGLLGHSAKGVTEKHYTGRPDALLLAAADRISEAVAQRLGLVQGKPPAKARRR